MSITRPDRDLTKLTPSAQASLQKILAELDDIIFVTEAWRSQERQDYLYSLWRSRPGSIVTWTRNSKHTQWRAVDIAFREWELYPPRTSSQWTQVANVFKKHGWIWWWDRQTVKDYPHFEYTGTPKDTAKDDWEKERKEATERVKKMGISNGERPRIGVTREQQRVMMYRYQKILDELYAKVEKLETELERLQR